jgi:hypothetical protein
MNDAAVVTRLMAGKNLLFFENYYLQVGLANQYFARGRQSNKTRADNSYIVAMRGWARAFNLMIFDISEMHAA